MERNLIHGNKVYKNLFIKMYSSKHYSNKIKSPQQQTLMQSFISTVTSSQLQDRSFINQSLFEMDKTLSKLYAKQHYDPQMVEKQTIQTARNLQKLKLPKTNTLTDALIRNTLGCDQKYAKQYMTLIEQTSQNQQKQNRIEEIKKSFTSSNKFNDTFANSKPFLTSIQQSSQKPVVDNQHQGYLKTQLIFLEKPNNKNITQKQYYEKYYDTITKKIEQLGGMDDTLSKMENTLKNNQMKSVKSREILRSNSKDQKKKDPLKLMQSNISNFSKINQKPTWTQKSKLMRQELKKGLIKP